MHIIVDFWIWAIGVLMFLAVVLYMVKHWQKSPWLILFAYLTICLTILNGLATLLPAVDLATIVLQATTLVVILLSACWQYEMFRIYK